MNSGDDFIARGLNYLPFFPPASPGKILTDDFADKEGLEMGDEYFANLDHIESVENFKEGYESEAHCSDSEGSGVDVSRIKIQPSALVSANPVGRPAKKSKSKSKHERSKLC